MKKYFAEFIGTAVLTLLGCGTAVFVGCGEPAGVAATALAFGLAACGSSSSDDVVKIGVVGTDPSNDKLVEVIRDIYSYHKPVQCYGECEALAMEGGRIISTEPFYAYLKIAEGCSNYCTYCAIPRIRGRFRSRKMEDILEEAKWLAEHGVKELVVIAQDTTRYGEDNYGRPMLPELLKELCRIDGLKWIRTLYSYPERITDELIDIVAKEDKLVKYFDIPIQHCNSEVLRRMNRHCNKEQITALVTKLRERIPGVILRTTVITGFPGETEEQFEELSAFVKQARFERLGAFAYSAEEDTPAAEFPDQIDEDIKQKRLETIYNDQSFIMDDNNEALVGKTFETVCIPTLRVSAAF